MILTQNDILKNINKGNIKIDPFDKRRLNPNSYNLSLGNKLLRYKDIILDPKIDNPVEEIIIPEDGLLLFPGILYLG